MSRTLSSLNPAHFTFFFCTLHLVYLTHEIECSHAMFTYVSIHVTRVCQSLFVHTLLLAETHFEMGTVRNREAS